MSAKEKGKCEDMAKADKSPYEREMKTYIPPPKGDQKEVQGPQCTQKASFFLFCSEYCPKIKGEHPGLSI
jgi:high mobility group protein B1